jgi:tRNA threonylcarbamoyladenosine biosynthesis protein TsaE
MVKTVSSINELRSLAETFLMALSKKPKVDSATLIGLSGDLGTGKTAFTKSVAALLNIDDTVTSPTFVLEKRYSIPQNTILGTNFDKLIHVDAYRLHKGEEMRALDWEATLADPRNLILLEWPEQVADALPSDMISLSFEYIDDGVRKVSGDYIK